MFSVQLLEESIIVALFFFFIYHHLFKVVHSAVMSINQFVYFYIIKIFF